MEANYTNFNELAIYAKHRAKRSARRRGHQEFTYWWRVMKWAEECSQHELNVQEEFNDCLATIKYRDMFCEDVTDTSWVYAQTVHLRKMLVNQGCEVERLSLEWLREEAALLDE